MNPAPASRRGRLGRRKRYVLVFVVALASISVAFILTDVLDNTPAATVVAYHAEPDTDPRIKTFIVDPSADKRKAGRVRGVMGQRFFEIPAGSSGPSDHQVRFDFNAPAEILQIDISVDIGDSRATLVEFAAAINSRQGYGLDRRADWLMHASWTRTTPGSGALEETTRLPDGVVVGKGDFVGISAWLGGVGVGDPIRVSPEVIVLYRWL